MGTLAKLARPITIASCGSECNKVCYDWWWKNVVNVTQYLTIGGDSGGGNIM